MPSIEKVIEVVIEKVIPSFGTVAVVANTLITSAGDTVITKEKV